MNTQTSPTLRPRRTKRAQRAEPTTSLPMLSRASIFRPLVGTIHAGDAEQALIAAAIARAIEQAGKTR